MTHRPSLETRFPRWTAVLLAGLAWATATHGAEPVRGAEAAGRVRHVSHSGSDATGTGSRERPWRTLRFAVGRLRPGDTLLVRGSRTGDDAAAVWAESLVWRSDRGPSGTPGARITIKAHPGETVRLQPDAGTTILRLIADRDEDDRNPRYLTFENLIFDARHLASGFAVKLEVGDGGRNVVADAHRRVHGPHHIRFVGCEVRNSPGQGIMVAAGDHNEFLRLQVHDNGTAPTSWDHGLYLSSSHNLVEGGSYHNNVSMGIQIWNESEGNEASFNTIRNVELRDNGHNRFRDRTSAFPRGVGVYTGRGNVVEGCRVWTTPEYAGVRYMGIDVDYGARDAVVRNCTVRDASRGHGGIHVGSGRAPSLFPDGSEKVGARGTLLEGNTLEGNTGGNEVDGQVYVAPTVAATTVLRANRAVQRYP